MIDILFKLCNNVSYYIIYIELLSGQNCVINVKEVIIHAVCPLYLSMCVMGLNNLNNYVPILHAPPSESLHCFSIRGRIRVRGEGKQKEVWRRTERSKDLKAEALSSLL